MAQRDPRRQRVVLDANVLYAMPLADTLLTAAAQRLFQLRWSAELLQEVRETMLKHQLPAAAVDRRLHAMQQAFRIAEVTGYSTSSRRSSSQILMIGTWSPRRSALRQESSSRPTCRTFPARSWQRTGSVC
jgi:hypothetical protein